MTKIVCVVNGSEDDNISETNILEDLIDGNVTFFSSIQEMLDDDEDYSNCKVFVMEVGDFGMVQSNPKFVSLKEEPKKKVSKK